MLDDLDGLHAISGREIIEASTFKPKYPRRATLDDLVGLRVISGRELIEDASRSRQEPPPATNLRDEREILSIASHVPVLPAQSVPGASPDCSAASYRATARPAVLLTGS